MLESVACRVVCVFSEKARRTPAIPRRAMATPTHCSVPAKALLCCAAYSRSVRKNQRPMNPAIPDAAAARW